MVQISPLFWSVAWPRYLCAAFASVDRNAVIRRLLACLTPTSLVFLDCIPPSIYLNNRRQSVKIEEVSFLSLFSGITSGMPQ